MPPGWQPPGGQTAFAPRKLDPEVPQEFWPGRQRNPLGDASNGGMFRWPKALRPDSDDGPRTITQRGNGAALVSTPRSTPPSRRAEALAAEAARPKQPWEVLMGTSSGDHQPAPNLKSKALFAIGRQRASRPATQVAQTRPAPVARPTAPPATAPVAAVAQQRAASRLKSPALADAQPPVRQIKKGPLTWRAKGTPSNTAPATKPTSPDHSKMQMAAHTQPVAPTPAASAARAPANPVANPAPAPGSTAPPQAPAVPTQPSQPQPQIQPIIRQKALIPQEILRGQPTNYTQPVREPAFRLTSRPQTNEPLVPEVVERKAPPPTGTPGVQPALFPEAFIENLAGHVNLATKPPPAEPVGMRASSPPVYIVVRPQDFDELLDAYYAPRGDGRSASSRKSSRRRTRGDRLASRTARPQAHVGQPGRTRPQMAPTAERRAADSRSYKPPGDIPPLVKPLWMISEITKLPSFLSGKPKGPPVPRPPSLGNRYRSTVARRADPQTLEIGPAKEDVPPPEAPAEADLEESPDVSVELTSKPRKTADDEAAPAEPNRGQRSKPTAASKAELTAREELHQIYLSATAGRSKKEADPEEPRGRRVTGDGDEPREKAVNRQGNVPAAAIEVDPKPEHPRKKTTRIRKSDGSSVTVYHAGTGARRAAEDEQLAEPTAKPSKSSKPAAARGQESRENKPSGKFRHNPLR